MAIMAKKTELYVEFNRQADLCHVQIEMYEAAATLAKSMLRMGLTDELVRMLFDRLEQHDWDQASREDSVGDADMLTPNRDAQAELKFRDLAWDLDQVAFLRSRAIDFEKKIASKK